MQDSIIQFWRIFDLNFDFLINTLQSKLHKSSFHDSLEGLIRMTMRSIILLTHSFEYK